MGGPFPASPTSAIEAPHTGFAVAGAGPEYEPLVFVGRTEGRIVAARGPPEFGWDPIFQPDGFEEVCSREEGKRRLVAAVPVQVSIFWSTHYS